MLFFVSWFRFERKWDVLIARAACYNLHFIASLTMYSILHIRTAQSTTNQRISGRSLHFSITKIFSCSLSQTFELLPAQKRLFTGVSRDEIKTRLTTHSWRLDLERLECQVFLPTVSIGFHLNRSLEILRVVHTWLTHGVLDTIELSAVVFPLLI